MLVPLYPLALHFGISAGSVTPGILILSLLLLVSGVGLSIKGDSSGWLLLLLGLALLVCQVHYPPAAEMMLFLPPVLINCLLGFLFARTLRKGSVPLISTFAKLAHDHELDEVTLRYTRTVTKIWVGMFVFFALQSLLLAVFAPLAVWSLFTNFINYMLVVLLFFVEYQVRIRHLPQLEHPGFIGFMRLVKKFDLRSLSKS